LYKSRTQYKIGITAAFVSAAIWGVLPVYWQALRPIESSVIIFYRITLAGVVCFIVALKLYGIRGITTPLKVKGAKLKFFIAGVLITTNWSIYIWAVNADHVIQTCIGYYIEPLMVCVFGIIIFREKFTKFKALAFLMACGGVLIILVYFGELPVIALSLAVTFATYAAMKKTFRIEAMLSLLYETMFLAPAALAVIVYLEITGNGALGTGQPYQYVMLLFCGLFTAIPLGTFAFAANKIPLITLGLMEYISPSINLIIGIFLLKEPFDAVQFSAFAVIWAGLAFFTYGEIKNGGQKNDITA